MSNHRKPTAQLTLIMAMTVGIASCVTTNPPPSVFENTGFPISWTQEFNMADLLEDSIDVYSQKDLAQLMERLWYASLAVQLPATSELRTLNNCNDYLAIETEKPVARRDQENNALLELMVMCEATRLLSRATAAHSSNIPPSPLHAHSPEEFPKVLGLVTSESEKNLVRSDPDIFKWSDVNSVSEAKRLSPDRFAYYSDSGMQILSLIGRGDFDADGLEDILIRSTDSVEGGSYFDMRLFALTVDKHGLWRAIDEDIAIE